jgi:hypothetical protein
VKIVQAARDFGVPIEAIRNLKNELFVDCLADIQKESEEFYQYHRDFLGTSEEEIQKIKQFLAFLDTHREDNLPNLIHWGFINPKETKVLEAIRSKDFQSILIKINADETMVIEGTIETDLKDDKAKQVRRILGLKEYEEITIKYRNEKHLYLKNTQRL